MNESYYYEGKIAEYELERSEHYWLIPVVPMLWYGFQTFRNKITMIANCTDQPHHPEETESLSADSYQTPLPMESVKINSNNIEILF